VDALHYKYTKEEVKVEPEVANKKEASDEIALAKNAIPKADTVDLSQAGVLYAQPIVNGFQLVNSTPKVVMKVFKTSSPTCLIAMRESIQVF
jgi:hypothetical protein